MFRIGLLNFDCQPRFANLKVRDSTTGPSNIKLKASMYFSLCIDVAKMHNVLMLMNDVDN